MAARPATSTPKAGIGREEISEFLGPGLASANLYVYNCYYTGRRESGGSLTSEKVRQSQLGSGVRRFGSERGTAKETYALDDLT